MTTERKIRYYEGAVAIITGGASGIGAALGRELASRGCEVVLADLQIELAEHVAAEIRGSGGKAMASQLNVVDCLSLEALVRETVERCGRLDFMFNNAGIAVIGPVSSHAMKEWYSAIDVNLYGVIHGIQAAYRVMSDQGFGHIINTASLAGLVPSPGTITYSATKYAVVGLSKVLRIEAALIGIRVSVLCPGYIRTPMLDRGGKYGKVLHGISSQKMTSAIERLSPMQADVFASRALDAIARNEAIIVIPGWYRFFWLLERLSPALNLHLSQKQYQSVVGPLTQGEPASGIQA